MSVRVKCNKIGCETCSRGRLIKNLSLKEEAYYCKSEGRHKRRNANECSSFRCKRPYEYFCKTCRGGK